MKLYIYTGEMLPEVIPSGNSNEIPAKDKLLTTHDQEVPYITTARVYFPEGKLHINEQIRMTELVILAEKDKRNIQLFSQSPWVIEYAWWLGKKHGFETKIFHVIPGENRKPIFEDPKGDNIECVYASINKAIHVLESIQEEVENMERNKEDEDGNND